MGLESKKGGPLDFAKTYRGWRNSPRCAGCVGKEGFRRRSFILVHALPIDCPAQQPVAASDPRASQGLVLSRLLARSLSSLCQHRIGKRGSVERTLFDHQSSAESWLHLPPVDYRYSQHSVCQRLNLLTGRGDGAECFCSFSLRL